MMFCRTAYIILIIKNDQYDGTGRFWQKQTHFDLKKKNKTKRKCFNICDKHKINNIQNMHFHLWVNRTNEVNSKGAWQDAGMYAMNRYVV